MSDGYDPADDGRRSYEAAIAAKRARGDDYYLKPSFAIELPWPSRVLHPNARVHWAKRAKEAKKARLGASWEAYIQGARRIEAKALDVTAIFSPPDRRARDADGMLSNIKSYLDGIADVIGVDDSRWNIAIRRREPTPNGAVRIEIEVASGMEKAA